MSKGSFKGISFKKKSYRGMGAMEKVSGKGHHLHLEDREKLSVNGVK